MGQEQQFTLILQTLQQLRDVYGDDVDKIVQGNTSNIVFLKSTDDSMLDTLQKMSGVTHVSRADGKNITKDHERLFMQNEGKVTINVQTKEEPVISYNDLAFIGPRNSIVFRAGDSPIWNRNETILPMSWRLLKNTIKHPGHTYTLQTIPTLSSALDFDVRKNQPDFSKMLNKRLKQARKAKDAIARYQAAYGLTDDEIQKLDIDVYSDEIMAIINQSITDDELRKKKEADQMQSSFDYDDKPDFSNDDDDFPKSEPNTEQRAINQKYQEEYNEGEKAIYAGKILTRHSLVCNGFVNHSFDVNIVNAYRNIRGDFEQDHAHFVVKNGNLYDVTGQFLYIEKVETSKDLDAINQAGRDPKSTTYSNGNVSSDELKPENSYAVTDAFYHFLVSMDHWAFARGRFEQEMAKQLL